MADYYPLLARALDALPDRTPALRKAVYDRARNALLGQLRTLEPPLPEADIEAERQALDTAIARLETDYGTPTPAASPAPEPATVTAAPTPVVSSDQPPGVRQEANLHPEAVPLALAPQVVPPGPRDDVTSPRVLPEAGPLAAFVPSRRSEPVEIALPAPANPIEKPSNARALQTAESPNGQRPRLDVKPPRADRSRQLRNLFLGGVLAAVIALIAVAAILLADKRVDLSQLASDAPEAGRIAADTKLSDRVGGDRSDLEPRPAGSEPGRPDVTVAQRAVLYEENASDSKAPPAATQGRATWRLETLSGDQGQPLQSAVRAVVDFPDAGLTLTMTIRKNLDASLPASHTIELAFSNTGVGEKRAVQEIGLLQLKDEESARGSPVSGLPVRVRDNLFLLGLSNLPGDIERNTELLLRRNWFDLAVKYKNGQRGILSFEKGAAGGRVVQSAFDQWRS